LCGNQYETLLIYLRRNGLEKKHCGCKGRNINTEVIRQNSALGVQKMIEMGIVQKDPKLSSAKEVYRNYKDGDLSFDNFVELTQQNCFYCGAVPGNCYNVYFKKIGEARKNISPERISNGYFTYNGLDRVDSSKPHNIDNVVPCCHPCNWSKSNRTQQEFFDWIVKVFRFLDGKGLI
jgi:hypothetical protein